MVAIDDVVTEPLCFFIVPRDHVAAAAWIQHMNWWTEPGIAPGVRNVGPERSRATLPTFAGYENAWSTLAQPTDDVPILLPPQFHGYALNAARAGAATSAPMAHSVAELVIESVNTRLSPSA